MTDQLLPCPFCGAEPILQEHPAHAHSLQIGEWKMPDHPGSWTVECCACNCGMINQSLEQVTADWNRRADHQCKQGEYGDAYQGAREDLAIWKRRALEAESRVRQQDQIIDQMGEDLNAINGPTFMGEPVLPSERQSVTDAARDVLAERQRQISAEDFDASHDNMATRGQLAMAAGLYAIDAAGLAAGKRSLSHPSVYWPWPEQWWKPSGARRNLVKAGALILAEIERLDRAAPSAEGGA